MTNSIVNYTADKKQAPIRTTAVVQQMNRFKSASLVETGLGVWGDPGVMVGGEAGVGAVSAGSTVP